MIPDDLAEPGSTPMTLQTQAPTMEPARVALVYNDPGELAWPERALRRRIPWGNAGMPHEPLRYPEAAPGTAAALIDREDYEWNRAANTHNWQLLLSHYEKAGWPKKRIAYDPFGWDPAKLRRTLWSSLPLSSFTTHMRTRRAMLPFLEGWDGAATDCYPPAGYTTSEYLEWARLKIQAHVRVCREGGLEPWVLLALEPGGIAALALPMQAGLVADVRGRFGFDDIRWGLWGWAPADQPAKRMVHLAAAHLFMSSLDAMGVPVA